MKLAIVGATGNTGLSLAQQAAEKGHEVVAIMRNTSKFAIQHEKIKVLEGNLLSVESLTEHFQGCDAVMSCIGAHTMRNVSIYSESVRIITEAMKKTGISRFVGVTSWCTTDNPNDRGPFVLEWILKPTILKSALADMAVMEKHLRESCSDIKYTVVRPPELTNMPITDKQIKVEMERLHVPGGSTKIARADLARFMLMCLETEEYNGKMVSVAV